MAEVTRTVAIDSNTQAEYEKALALLELEQQKTPGWTIYKEPLIHKVTAVKVEELNLM